MAFKGLHGASDAFSIIDEDVDRLLNTRNRALCTMRHPAR